MIGDFTPFGYLRNPGHAASSWGVARGGNLRSAPDWLGVEWAYPVARAPTARVGLGLEMGAVRTRADFDAIGLTSRYHSCLIFGFDWQLEGLQVEARFFLASDDALCLRVAVVNHASQSRRVQLRPLGLLDGGIVAAPIPDEPFLITETPSSHAALWPAYGLETDLDGGGVLLRLGVLARGSSRSRAIATATAALANAEARFEQLLAEDAQFYSSCPRLTGDWPAHWPEGLHHDFETTRLLVQPAGGIFGDVWPSWMAAWPRVVLAEGTLDMLRLAYADPALAQRCILSMFRDAPQPNLPCVFRDGEYNMVAADGSRCGTSPAWCLPFLQLELLYLRTLDREWLGQLYPFACGLVEWWLGHRTDAHGWIVYKCTWESGEDGNPRLDPAGTGDADISGRVRPVELQATVAHAAGVLAFFASELGQPADVPRWRAVEAAYRDRTRQLFDPGAGRFRDLAVGAETSPHGLYWGIDPHAFSVQALTPVLIGERLPDAEILRYFCPPWTLWPSWTTTLVESACAAGLLEAVGSLAFETIDRVYRVTTRRELGSLERPMPGCAPEFWPTDWRTYNGSDAYGWGATTANLLIRHLFGFKESRQTDGWSVTLAPALPAALLQPGHTYGIRRLNYRGLVFDLSFSVQPSGIVEAELDLGTRARQCQAGDAGQQIYASTAPASRHRFPVQLGTAVSVRLS